MGEEALFFWLGVGLAVYLLTVAVGCSISLWKWNRRKKRGENYE